MGAVEKKRNGKPEGVLSKNAAVEIASGKNASLERARRLIRTSGSSSIMEKIAAAGLAATLLYGTAIYGGHMALKPDKTDPDEAQNVLVSKSNGDQRQKEKKFRSRKFDIQQSLEISNIDYSSQKIGCVIHVPAVSSEYGQAFLLDGLTDMGYLHQIGPAHGISFETMEDRNFSVAYMAGDPAGKILSLTANQAKDALPPNEYYRVGMSLEGDDLIASVSDMSGNPIKIIKAPSYGSKRFVGGILMIRNNYYYSTGVETETISARKNVATDTATYFLLSPMPSGKRDYKITSTIISSALGGQDTCIGTDYRIPVREIKRLHRSGLMSRDSIMENFTGSLMPASAEMKGPDGYYSFTTSSK